MNKAAWQTAASLLVMSLSLGSAGCWWFGHPSEPSECWDGECEESLPPTLTVSIPEWPPIGADSTIAVTGEGDVGLDSLTTYFRLENTHWLDGSTILTREVPGSELGEGLGTLEVELVDWRGGWTVETVTNVLVDLTPPEAFLDDLIVRASSDQLAFWIGDAWIVSSYELSVAGTIIASETLEPGYPPTVGVDWDLSYVSIPSELLPVGALAADLTVVDAAGNKASFPISLLVDGVSPTLSMTSPEEGAVLDGAFEVVADATDDSAHPVALEVYVGDTLVATGVGPLANVTLWASDFPEGVAEVTVIAVDEAGNRSAPAVRHVTFAAEPE
jgi:hypothetical protein